MWNLLKPELKKIKLLRLLKRNFNNFFYSHPNWSTNLKKPNSFVGINQDSGQKTNRILIATSVGSHIPGTTLESLLAVALTLRNAKVEILLCDNALPACLACDSTWYPNLRGFVKNGPAKDLCLTCFNPAFKMFSSLGLKINRYSDFINPEDNHEAENLLSSESFEDLTHFSKNGVQIGEHAKAGALRFFARATLDEEKYGREIFNRYFKASYLTYKVIDKLLSQNNFDAAVFHHGIYVPQGIIGEVAREKKLRIINWNPAYRKDCFIFSHGDTYHHTLMNEPVEKWNNLTFSENTEKHLFNYLKSRWTGKNDWIYFHNDPNLDPEEIYKHFEIDKSKPLVGLLTNVMWDAQLHYPANAFKNMLDWVIKTINYFKSRTDIQLLIRIHPAEIRGTLPSRQPIIDEIHKHFKTLPKNVFIIPPENNLSTYSAMMKCDSVLIYGTKTGVELSSFGIPVIVAGEAWVRNKGITYDCSSENDYFEILDKIPLNSKLDKERLEKAKKYAFHFFFRRMLPVPFVEKVNDSRGFKINLKNIDDLKPGKSKGLDVICDGILLGSDFIYKAENYL